MRLLLCVESRFFCLERRFSFDYFVVEDGHFHGLILRQRAALLQGLSNGLGNLFVRRPLLFELELVSGQIAVHDRFRGFKFSFRERNLRFEIRTLLVARSDRTFRFFFFLHRVFSALLNLRAEIFHHRGMRRRFGFTFRDERFGFCL